MLGERVWVRSMTFTMASVVQAPRAGLGWGIDKGAEKGFSLRSYSKPQAAWLGAGLLFERRLKLWSSKTAKMMEPKIICRTDSGICMTERMEVSKVTKRTPKTVPR
jgi:hypothetical protein